MNNLLRVIRSLLPLVSVLIVFCFLSQIYRNIAAKSLKDGARLPKFISVEDNVHVPLGFRSRSLNPDPLIGGLVANLTDSHFHFDVDTKLYDESPSETLTLLQTRNERVTRIMSGKTYKDFYDLLNEKLLKTDIPDFEFLLRLYAPDSRRDEDENKFESYLENSLGVAAIAALGEGQLTKARTYAHIQADLLRALDPPPKESSSFFSKALTLEAILWSPNCFSLRDDEIKQLAAWIDDPFVPVDNLRQVFGDSFVEYAHGRQSFSLHFYEQAASSFQAAQQSAVNSKLVELSRLMQARSLFWGATLRDSIPISIRGDNSTGTSRRQTIALLIQIADKISTNSYRDDVDYYILHLL